MSQQAILLSGGLDSVALAALMRPALAIAVDYGQTCARAELTAAKAVAAALSLRFLTVRADCSSVGSCDLGGSRAPVGPCPLARMVALPQPIARYTGRSRSSCA
jgi:7-cyano-7-deazaguanine synthase